MNWEHAKSVVEQAAAKQFSAERSETHGANLGESSGPEAHGFGTPDELEGLLARNKDIRGEVKWPGGQLVSFVFRQTSNWHDVEWGVFQQGV